MLLLRVPVRMLCVAVLLPGPMPQPLYYCLLLYNCHLKLTSRCAAPQDAVWVDRHGPIVHGQVAPEYFRGKGLQGYEASPSPEFLSPMQSPEFLSPQQQHLLESREW